MPLVKTTPKLECLVALREALATLRDDAQPMTKLLRAQLAAAVEVALDECQKIQEVQRIRRSALRAPEDNGA